MADFMTPYGRGHYETRDDPVVTLVATTPTQIARAAGPTVALTMSAHATPAIAAAAMLTFYGGEFGAPTWSFALALGQPAVTVRREEIGDLIDGAVSAYVTSGTPSVKVTRVVFVPEGKK